jgi:hypothetical protein
MAFLPEQFVIPAEWRTKDLWLRVLRSDVTELDYAALMESRERLRQWSDSTWPSDDFTLQENERDLIEHEREWEDREAFAYTVLDPDGLRCEGCVYINSLADSIIGRGHDLRTDGAPLTEDAAVVSFWVRDSALERDLDRQLLAGLNEWFRSEWPFSQLIYRINDNLHRDRELLEGAGFVHSASFPSKLNQLTWHLYAEP